MRAEIWLSLVLIVGLPLPKSAHAAVALAGEAYVVGAQAIQTPPSDSSPVVLRQFVAEGEAVKTGDVVLRIDGGAAASSLTEFRSQLTLARAKADKETAELEVKALDAERALRTAQTALDKAKIDSTIPPQHISALDRDRYQGELTRATRELELKSSEWSAATQAAQRRVEDARLELGQLDAQIVFAQTQLTAAEVLATRDGIVVHGFDPWRGLRYDEGSSSYPGQRVGEIVNDGETFDLAVRAWALDVDRPALKEGDAVSVSFDGASGAPVAGTIGRIGGAPQPKAEWGDGRYFDVDIALTLVPSLQKQLRPGSSARVLVGGSVSAAARKQKTDERLDGEIVAFAFSAIAPPTIGDQWMLTVTQLVPDGTQVSAGQVVAAFDGNEVMRRLNEKKSALNEKRTQLQSLSLALAERGKAETIATEEQRSKLDKALRKASQPANLIAAMEYQKLVAEKELAELEMELVARREKLAARQRVAERQQIEAEIALLQSQVAEFEMGIAKLNVKAERGGVMLHLSSPQGEKFDVGSQVFRGQSIAQIPDLGKLGVRMQVPERSIARVHLGQRAKIDVEGGAVPGMIGKVTVIGRVVRSKSRVNPVPVVDVSIEFEDLPAGSKLKPGQPVRIELIEEGGI